MWFLFEALGSSSIAQQWSLIFFFLTFWESKHWLSFFFSLMHIIQIYTHLSIVEKLSFFSSFLDWGYEILVWESKNPAFRLPSLTAKPYASYLCVEAQITSLIKWGKMTVGEKVFLTVVLNVFLWPYRCKIMYRIFWYSREEWKFLCWIIWCDMC